MKKMIQLGGLTSQVKGETGIRRLEDLIGLSHEISETYPKIEQRQHFLEAMGIDFTITDESQGKEDKKSLITSEAGVLQLLTNHFSLLFPKEEGVEIRRLLLTFSIEHYTSAEDLADDICQLSKTEQDDLLRKLGIVEEEILRDIIKNEEKTELVRILNERYSFLFPKDQKIRKSIYMYGISEISTAEQLSDEITKLPQIKAIKLLKKLGIKLTSVTTTQHANWAFDQNKLKKVLAGRYAYLFLSPDDILDLLSEYGIATTDKDADRIYGEMLKLSVVDRERLFRRLGLDPDSSQVRAKEDRKKFLNKLLNPQPSQQDVWDLLDASGIKSRDINKICIKIRKLSEAIRSDLFSRLGLLPNASEQDLRDLLTPASRT
jgi:hypothetical protein